MAPTSLVSGGSKSRTRTTRNNRAETGRSPGLGRGLPANPRHTQATRAAISSLTNSPSRLARGPVKLANQEIFDGGGRPAQRRTGGGRGRGRGDRHTAQQ